MATKNKTSWEAIEKKMLRNNEKIRKLRAENASLEEELKNVTKNAFPLWTGKIVTISGTFAMSFSYEVLAFYGKFSRAEAYKGQIIVTFEFATIASKDKNASYCHSSFHLFTLHNFVIAYKDDEKFAIKEANDCVLDKAFDEIETTATLDLCRLIKKHNKDNNNNNEGTENNVLLGTHPEKQEQG